MCMPILISLLGLNVYPDVGVVEAVGPSRYTKLYMCLCICICRYMCMWMAIQDPMSLGFIVACFLRRRAAKSDLESSCQYPWAQKKMQALHAMENSAGRRFKKLAIDPSPEALATAFCGPCGPRCVTPASAGLLHFNCWTSLH